ncbi:hypothetical protein PCANC_21480 [Puccinia coronata f. sp. avenae]|uniref:Sodium/calcium exchanger membrane region domain-containing protein n=1 Tax=Puccinia coronata f. sp. avenae TaxID=200324 RepID=A0A2N5U054_9BASI|nr:hypothetical protein PCANC_21480 [Puccinia coronata f. sp. avenae]
MNREQKQLYRLIGLTVSVLITIHLINYQASNQLLLTNTHPAARLAARSTPASSETQHEPSSLIDYSRIYYSQPTRNRKALVILFLVLWLSFLFSFVGIVASDFFCPNLSTISFRLGLSENLAGVTLLGFGNGAPDVFSTFAAMKANTGSLAIGELIGAASFIVSVVVGSMSIIRPFKVPRHSFLRDLGFFIVAIMFVLVIIKNGVIYRWQANSLVLLYLVYVAAVLFSTWSIQRKRIKLDQLQIARSEYTHDDQLLEPYLDDPDFPIQPNPPMPELNQEISSNPPSRSSPQLVPPSQQSRPALHRMNTSSSMQSHDSFKSLLETSCYPLPLPVRQRRMRAPSLSYRSDNPGPPINPLGSSTSSNGTGLNHSVGHPAPPRSISSQDGIGSPEILRRRRRNTVMMNPIRPSLLGAIEFRDVVNSLARDSVSHAVPRFHGGRISPQLSHSTSQGRRSRSGSVAVVPRANSSSAVPPRPIPFPVRSASDRPHMKKTEFALPGIVTHNHRTTGRHRLTQSQSSILPSTPRPCDSVVEQPSPKADAVEPADDRESIIDLPSKDQPNLLLLDHVDDGPTVVYPSDQTRRPSSQTLISPMHKSVAPLPSILITSDRQETVALLDSPDHDDATRPTPSVSQSQLRADRRRRWRVLMKVVWETLFPTLKDWRIKSLLGKAVAIVSAPAVLVLTLTLPVVDETEEDLDPHPQHDKQEDADDDGDDAAGGLLDSDEERTVGLGVHRDADTQDAAQEDEPISPLPGPPDADGNCRRSRLKQSYRDRLSEEEEQGDGKAVSFPMVDVGHASNQKIGVDVVGENGGRSRGRDGLRESCLMGRSGLDDRSGKMYDGAGESRRSEAGSSSSSEEEEWGVEEAGRGRYSDQHIARILATVQSFLAPTFWLVCLAGSTSSSSGAGPEEEAAGPTEARRWWYDGAAAAGDQGAARRRTGTAIAALLLGALLARLVYRHLGPGPGPACRSAKAVKIALCFLGFANSMLWILNIVNEVIHILTTFGAIFHLSNAILGLTIFGIGNSLGDFVANVTLAKMGFPVMAMSACFGGPLLNILLGIGLSSSLVMTTRGTESVGLASSKSLLVSTGALLAVLLLMLLLVPLCKNFTFDKHTGILLILAYSAVFSLNLLVEACF